MWSFIVNFIDANQLGGWVRAGVAAGLGAMLGKWPMLASVFGPELQTAAGVLLSGIAVGVWSTIAKSFGTVAAVTKTTGP